jgi:hypothetical protein
VQDQLVRKVLQAQPDKAVLLGVMDLLDYPDHLDNQVQ